MGTTATVKCLCIALMHSACNWYHLKADVERFQMISNTIRLELVAWATDGDPKMTSNRGSTVYFYSIINHTSLHLIMLSFISDDHIHQPSFKKQKSMLWTRSSFT